MFEQWVEDLCGLADYYRIGGHVIKGLEYEYLYALFKNKKTDNLPEVLNEICLDLGLSFQIDDGVVKG